MADVLSAGLFANGLRKDFIGNYDQSQARQAASWVGEVMELGVPATNRQHEFAYYEATPHIQYWRRGKPIPEAGMKAVRWEVAVHEWGVRLKWLRWDRDDEQTQSLLKMAHSSGESAALLEERFLIDLMTATAGTLPYVPTGPDGQAMYSANGAGGSDRFGVSGGNVLATGITAGVAAPALVQKDFFQGVARFGNFQDGQGQPLFPPQVLDRGFIVVFPMSHLEVFNQAFEQQRIGIAYDATGAPAASSNVAAATPSNLVQDTSRNVKLVPTQRLTGDDWYIFLREPPTKAAFSLERMGLEWQQALAGDNNSDLVRTNAVEYVQGSRRVGAGINIPYATIKVDN